MKPDYVVDLETTGLLSAYGKPRRGVGISEWALLERGKEPVRKYTNVLERAVSSATDAKDYYTQLTSGQVVWQPGFAREHDVLGGVHARHYYETKRALEQGKKLGPEKEVIKRVQRLLASGKTVGAWNVEFDIGIMREVAEREGMKDFGKVVNRAFQKGQIVEMGDPARRFLYNLARKGDVKFGMLRKSLVRKALRGEISEEAIKSLQLKDLHERHLGFKKLFSEPDVPSYEAFKEGLSTKPWEYQEFAVGAHKPTIRYIKGWRQSIMAETISPGVLSKPTQTTLGRKMAERLGHQSIKLHEAKTDVVLSQILNEIFESPDPWKALGGFGVTSKGQFVTQFNTAVEKDYRSMLGTYLAESRAGKDTGLAYLRKMLSGKVDYEKAAPKIAAAAGTSSPARFVKDTYKGAFREMKDLAYKHPKTTTIAGIASAFILADAFIPEDNRLAGRRSSRSPYTMIDGIAFGGMNAPYRHALTDFGSGRGSENFSSYIRAKFVAGTIHAPLMGGYSSGEIETAQGIWSSALSKRNRRTLDKGEMEMRRSGEVSIPGVRPNAWLGVVDLRNYRVKAHDADTVSLYRRGLHRVFEKPVSVRLDAIDAPEVHPHQPAGRASTKYLEKLIDQQNSMKLLLDPFRTTYGRHVGILTGDVHPNINLKLVSAGAAASSDFRGIANIRAFKRAESLAATAGIGMWQSKGWQAHRMLGQAMGQAVSNVSLATGSRLAATMEAAAHGDLVSHLHWSPKERPWREYETDALHQVMAMRYKARNWPTNSQIKDRGYVPAINDGTSPWGIAGAGISPSDMEFSNVSAFSSGLSFARAEKVLRKADPLRRAFFPPAEPLMLPSVKKSTKTFFTTLLRDKQILHETMEPTVTLFERGKALMFPINVRPKNVAAIPPMSLKGMKRHTYRAAQTSAVGTVRSLMRRKPSFRSVDAEYSAHLALMPPWAPPNRLKIVKGVGFAGSWKDLAWAEFKSSKMNKKVAKAGVSEIRNSLRNVGLGLEDINEITGSYLYKAMNKIESGDISPWYTRALDNVSAAFWKVAKWEFDPNKKFDFRTWADNFTTKHLEPLVGDKDPLELLRKGTFRKTLKESFAKKARAEWRLRRAVWSNTVGKGSSPLAKFGGFLEFITEIGNPLRTFTPKEWKLDKFTTHAATVTERMKHGTAGYIDKARHHLTAKTANFLNLSGPIIGEQSMSKLKAWFSGAFAKSNAAALGKGLRAVGRKAFKPFELAISGFFAYSASRDYDNQALGFGTEMASWTANIATFMAIGGTLTTWGAVAGATAGAAIGSVFGGIGTLPGAALGKVIGAGAGWLLGAAATLAASEIVGSGVRYVGQAIAGKPRTPSPVMPTENPYESGRWAGTSTYGGTDQYLGMHGIAGSRPDMTGFGGGLKPLREAAARAFKEPAPAVLRRRSKRFARTSGLVNKVLWEKRHRMTRGRSSWPVQWEQTRRVTRPVNASRMMRAA